AFARRNQSEYEQSSQTTTETLWGTLMPWENDRALRLANVLTTRALEKLHRLRNTLENNTSVIDYVDPRFEGRLAQMAGFFGVPYAENWSFVERFKEEIGWLKTTKPDLYPMGIAGSDAAKICAGFGTYKRVWLLLLALEAYRLDHGQLPETL